MITQTPSCQRFPAFAGLLLCAALVLSACSGEKKGTADLNTPDAAQTATSSPSATVPPYTTKLKLTAEQKKEADAAVKALAIFTETMSNALMDKNFDSKLLRRVSTGDALTTAESDFKANREQGLRLNRKLYYKSIELTAVRQQSTSNNYVFLTCLPYSKIKFVKSDGSSPQKVNSKDSTFMFSVRKVNQTMLVTDQDFERDSC